jgi:hypothetical protein
MAAGDPGSPARYYSSTAVETALGSSIPAQSQGQSNTSFIVGSVSGFPSSYPYTLIVDPDTSKEEVVTVTAGSGTTLTVTRGSDNTQAVAHSAGAVVRHGVSGRDFRDTENHIAARGYDTDESILTAAGQTHVHGLQSGDGVVVGTTKTQTLTNKTLASPSITGTSGLESSLVFEGSTADAYETTLTITDPTADRTITFPDATGQVVLRDTTDTLTNKTLTSPTISGSPVITGLSSAGMVSSSATPKDYVDSILGSATAAATSAASAAASATAAATSATSASNSATASATSASASATSATAAATSAASAAASATAAATSATSAAASATAAATSATSAAASATAAANSVATIASYATAAANSASAAATSATSAATSATSAADSATAAAASATSAAASWDLFDDRYLGPKSTAPTVDNDGNPLTSGVIYYNTTNGNMYVYDGAAWVVFTSATAVTTITASTPLTGGGTGGTITVGIQDASTSQKGSVQLTDSVSSTSTTTAATPNSVKTAYDLAGTKVASVTSADTTRISIGGTGTAPTVDLVTTAVTAGSYSPASITVDAYGRITSASTAVISTDPIPQILMLGGM